MKFCIISHLTLVHMVFEGLICKKEFPFYKKESCDVFFFFLNMVFVLDKWPEEKSQQCSGRTRGSATAGGGG